MPYLQSQNLEANQKRNGIAFYVPGKPYRNKAKVRNLSSKAYNNLILINNIIGIDQYRRGKMFAFGLVFKNNFQSETLVDLLSYVYYSEDDYKRGINYALVAVLLAWRNNDFERLDEQAEDFGWAPD